MPLVSVQLWYKAGSALDDVNNPGLCHVTRTILEHRDDAALKLRAAGVRFESETLRDGCYFSSVLPLNFVEYVLDIEAGRMKKLAVSPEMVKAGLNAAAREYGSAKDEAARLDQEAERLMLAAMFPDHPYQHPPGLVAESLKDLKDQEKKLEELNKLQKEKNELNWNDRKKLENFIKRQH
ncbi:MAG: insulinase family protein [bacterium]|nr:insulinase family protein [bacterium]